MSGAPRNKRSRPSTSNPFYDVVIAKEIVPTKFFHEMTLQDLGLLDCTEAMLAHAGLGNFVELNAPTHANMTVEFLTTLQFWPEEGFLERIEFSYRKRKYVMTADQLRGALGITAPPSPNWNPKSITYQHHQWWGDVTGRGFRGGKEYNYFFTHPPLRIAHKVLAMSFFGHGEVNKVSAEDLKYLRTLSQECELIPDWAGAFIASCDKARTTDKGKISMGGMITLIIQALLDDISALSQPGTKDPPLKGFVYDANWLTKNHYLFPINDGYLWKSGQDKEHIIRLPRQFVYGPTETFRVAPDEAAALAAPGLAPPPPPMYFQHQAEAGPSGSQSAEEWQHRFYSDMQSGFTEMRAGFAAMQGCYTDLSTQFQQLSTSVDGIRQEVRDVRQHHHDEMEEIRGQWSQFLARYPPSQ